MDLEKHPDGRWRSFGYVELITRDKCSLDIFWVKDESLEDSANLPEPHVLAGEIADALPSALEQIESVLANLTQRGSGRWGGIGAQQPNDAMKLTSGLWKARFARDWFDPLAAYYGR
jgi:hypothetical protein